MRIAFSILALVFWAVTLLALGADLTGLYREGSFEATDLGTRWYELDSASLNLVQAATQRYLLPVIWDPFIVTLLLWPAWAVFGGGAILLTACGGLAGRRRRTIFGRR